MRVTRFASPIVTSLALAVLVTSASIVDAEVTLGSPFSDHMVLQRGVECPLWGTTTPGARVEIAIADRTVTVDADARGAFKAKLPRLDAGGPHTLTVTSDRQTTTLRDVLVGDVWLCSGQSNMEWSVLGALEPEKSIAGADRPNVRLLTVPKNGEASPVTAFQGRWAVCSPNTVPNFSAVAYFFGRRLNEELDVPIGLIHSSWGGTPAEAWTPLPALESIKDGMEHVTTVLARRGAAGVDGAKERYAAERMAWLTATGRLDPGIDPKAATWAEADLDTSDWKPMSLPADWRLKDLPHGCVWFRKEISVPAELAGQPLTLSLGRIDDFDVTFVNGTKVGGLGAETVDSWALPRTYEVPGELVRAGRNVIAVRVFDAGGAAGLIGPHTVMHARSGGQTIPLTGEWSYKMESEFKPMAGVEPPAPVPPMQLDNNQAPGSLYNGMIAPLADYGIKGAIWYQGESNAPFHAEYRTLLGAMIGAWREQFGVGAFPFYIVGLANFQAYTDDPNAVTQWAPLRAAQHATAKGEANVGTTVTIDIGDAKDIHPRNKQEVGRRLALMALADTYGKTLVSRGPTFERASFDGNAVTVTFGHVGGGLKMIGEKLESFAVAGEDGKFVWADARIDGDRVVLTAPGVANPTRVRYAWADNPKASLFNAEGLPAEPFEARK